MHHSVCEYDNIFSRKLSGVSRIPNDKKISDDQHDYLFTNDTISDNFFMKTLASFAFNWNTFSALRQSYIEQSKLEWKSQLKSNLDEIKLKCSELS